MSQSHSTRGSQRAPPASKRARTSSSSSSSSSSSTPPSSSSSSSSSSGHGVSEQQFEKLVLDCMRFFLSREAHGMPFSDNDLKKVLGKQPTRGLSKAVLNEAARRFKDLLGFEIYELDKLNKSGHVVEGLSGYYVLLNQLPLEFRAECGLRELEVKRGSPSFTLLTLVATCIKLKNDQIEEEMLFRCLKTMGLPPVGHHSFFGDWKELIHDLVKKRYLHKEKVNEVSQSQSIEPRKGNYIYRLGARFLIEIESNPNAISQFQVEAHGDVWDAIKEAEMSEDKGKGEAEEEAAN